VNRLEQKLVDAYQAAADTVTREMDEPNLTSLGRWGGGRRPGSGAGITRIAAPLAAAAAVAAVALVLSLIAIGGHGPKPTPSAVTQPPYFLGIQNTPHGPTEYAFTAYVYSSATGRQTSHVTLPRSDLWVRAVASLGKGSYVVAATKSWPHFGCRSWLYQFRLTGAGQPTGMKPFVVPAVSGWAMQLSAGSSGRVAVVTTSTCGRGSTQFTTSYQDRSTAIWLPSGATSSWSPWPSGSHLIPENLTPSPMLSADGRLLAFVAIAGQPKDFGQNEQAAYVMRTGQVSGPGARRYHLVVNPPGAAGVIAAVPSLDGRKTFVMTARQYGGRWHEMIGTYATGTGKLITVLASASMQTLTADGYLVLDPSGAHLLVLGFGNRNTAVLNIATHRLSVLHVHYRYPPLGAAW